MQAIAKLFTAVESIPSEERTALVSRLRGVRDAGHNGAGGALVLNAVIRVLKRAGEEAND